MFTKGPKYFIPIEKHVTIKKSTLVKKQCERNVNSMALPDCLLCVVQQNESFPCGLLKRPA
jgi:hypothetical protein